MRALILSDIHANFEALEAVLSAAEGQWDELWNLGDTVGYGGSPNEVLDRLRPIETLVVRGNHDRACCGITSTTSFNPVARAAAVWTSENLTLENLARLKELPQGPLYPAGAGETAEAGDAGITCAHGSPLNEDQYILNVRDAWAPLQQMTTPLTFFGHTHIQGGFSQKDHRWQELRTGIARPGQATLLGPKRTLAASTSITLESGTRHLINPGSVGQPRDFDWRAAFALFDTESRELTFHRVPYDLVSAQGRILMAGLPERLAARLREGR